MLTRNIEIRRQILIDELTGRVGARLRPFGYSIRQTARRIGRPAFEQIRVRGGGSGALATAGGLVFQMGGDGGAWAGHRSYRCPLFHGRVRVQSLPGEGESRDASHMEKQWTDGPHDRGLGWIVVNGAAETARHRQRHFRQTGNVHTHLQGVSVDVRANHRRTRSSEGGRKRACRQI